MRQLTPIVKNLIIANVLVFVAQFMFGRQGIDIESWAALFPYGTPYFKIWQLVTYMFLHGGLMHIFFNMFTLFIFGPILENLWGAKRFFNFYIICGIAAGLAHLFINPGFSIAVGASGAIMGIMAAFAYLFPNTELMLMFIPVPIKAKYLIPGFMALDIFGAFAGVPGDNIAHWAHLGGALAGFILVFIWNKTNRNTFY
jgi:membrane associated rhomboid family serine protease